MKSLCLSLVLSALCLSGMAAAKTPSPDEGAFYTGKYRNLLAEAGIGEDDIAARLDRMWRFYFENENENQRLYWQSAVDEGYVVDINNRDIRTEGMSYAMMIAVQMNKKAHFDSLWRFAYRKMLVKEGPLEGYFCWHVDPATEECLSNGPAPDGEEYFAMALYFADHVWGSSDGELNYRAHADEILREMLHQEEDNGGVKRGIHNMIDDDANMIVFVPGYPNNQYTDPSYHVPAFYHLWSLWGPEADQARWASIRDTSRDYLASIQDMRPETCLMPDYANFDGTPYRAPFNTDSEFFKVDAWRTIFNWSLDYAWFAADARQPELSDCLLGFFHDRQRGGGGIGAKSYKSSYRLDGRPLRGAGDRSSGLISMNATGVLAMPADEGWAYDFVLDLWNTDFPEGPYRYYNGMLYMLAMLAVSGEYEIHQPEESSAP